MNEKFWAWYSSSKGKSSAKQFGNVIHSPLVKHEDEDVEVIDILVPPELHLLIGVVNTLYSHMIKVWPQANIWPKKCYVEKEAMHGGAFNGNSCMTLLNNVDLLRSMCPIQCLRFVELFSLFKSIVKSCFSTTLLPDFRDHIHDFRKAYKDSGLPVTPKLHMVFYHVTEFCCRTGGALGIWSEQATEAAHSDFKVTWNKYKVNLINPRYPERILHAVCEYNSLHL